MIEKVIFSNLLFFPSAAPVSPWQSVLTTIAGQINDLQDATTRLTVWGEIEALMALSQNETGPFKTALQKLYDDFQKSTPAQIQNDFKALSSAPLPPLPSSPADYFKQAMYALVMKLMQDVENPLLPKPFAFFAELQGLANGMVAFGNLMGAGIASDCSYVIQNLTIYANLQTTDSQLTLLESLYGLATDVNNIL